MKRWWLLLGLGGILSWSLIKPAEPPTPHPIARSRPTTESVRSGRLDLSPRTGASEREHQAADDSSDDLRPQVVDDENLEGVANARIRFDGRRGILGDSLSRRVEESGDLEGYFDWPALEAGYYDITVEAPGYQSYVERNVLVRGPPSPVESEFPLTAAEVLEGRVVDEAGQAVVGAQVWSVDEQDGRDTDARTETLTDEQGVFELSVPSGDAVTLLVVHPRFVTTSTTVNLLDVEAAELVLRLETSAPTYVRVLDEDGAPIAGASVDYYSIHSDFDLETRSVPVSTDGAGRARFILGDVDSASFEVRARGYELVDQAFTVPEDEREEIVIVLRTVDIITFHVTFETGRPAVGAQLLVTADGEELPGEFTDYGHVGADGFVQLGLPIGQPARVEVVDSSVPELTLEIDELTARQDIVLPAPAWIRAQIVGDESEALPRAVAFDSDLHFEDVGVDRETSVVLLGPFPPGPASFELSSIEGSSYRCEACMVLSPGLNEHVVRMEPDPASDLASLARARDSEGRR